MSKHSPQKNTHTHAVESQKQRKPQPNLWPPVAVLAILAYGLYRAIDLRWICDDAFITLRYVRNFVEGKGLVYNVGERVEGYTHFLWLMLISFAKAIGFDPVDASMWLGIAAFAGIIVLLLFISFREHKKTPKAIWLPIAAALFVLNYDTAEWASGGLETSFYTLLILVAFYTWFYSKFNEQRRLLMTGIALALASLTRPDAVLFTLAAVALLVTRDMRKGQPVLSVIKPIGILLLPSVAIGVPYLIWKYFYYGDLLPLPYYAKSADGNYFAQGFFYIWLYFRVHFVSALALIGAVSLFFVYRNTNGEEPADTAQDPGSPFIAALIGIAVYLLLFVARVGGDFMFARFIIPVVPLICFMIERSLEHLPEQMRRYQVGIAAALVLLSILEERLPTNEIFRLGDGGKRVENWNLVVKGTTQFVADERWFYYDHFEIKDHQDSIIERGNMDMYSESGKYLEPLLRGMPLTVAVPGANNMVAYYANFPVCINEYGLTDSSIAHSVLPARAHIGHEKRATDAYLQQRHVNFELGGIVGKLPNPLPQTTMAFYLPSLDCWQLARVITYDRATMEELSKRFMQESNKSVFPIYEKIISYYIERVMPTRSLNQVEQDYAAYRKLYFDQHPNRVIQALIETRIRELRGDTTK
jgi:hypothetical protein